MGGAGLLVQISPRQDGVAGGDWKRSCVHGPNICYDAPASLAAKGRDISNPDDASPDQISDVRLFLLAVASAVVTANAYYIHPIISPVAADFGIDEGFSGIVPAANQIALALGIFLLLPLGDWFSNRKLVVIFALAQTLSLLVMALAQDFRWFVAGSTALGFSTIAPYLLPAYVSKRVAPERLGYANAVLTTGIIVGILIARAGAGVVGEYLGWRTVYVIAVALMIGVTGLLPLLMEDPKVGTKRESSRSYLTLLGSIVPIIRQQPEILLAGAIQGLSFGIFIAVWMGIGLHLPSPEMGYGVDVVGYLALIALVNLFTTPRFGALADRMGARRARVRFAAFQLFGIFLFFFAGGNLWLLIVPLLLTNLVGPLVDITGRMTFLSQAPEIRTRLMTVYIVLMFAGGGVGSWAGTAVYAAAGWTGTAMLVFTCSCLVVALSLLDLHWERRRG